MKQAFILFTLLFLLLVCVVAAQSAGPGLKINAKNVGIVGTGSNMFRSGIAHSSGVVYIGTYGPQPAIVWKYNPANKRLTKVGAPGEYQLDSMVEAPNGHIYIGTAYSGIVYDLDPKTDKITSLGAPPVDSTMWIFTMMRTKTGEIYGARGVGMFQLDWRTGKMEGFGVVPGDHKAGGYNASNPITRTLEERPNGIIWGDTNTCIFTFDPKTKKITVVADVLKFDKACYGVAHPNGQSPVQDLYFSISSRFGSGKPKYPLCVCRAATGKIEPVKIDGLLLGGTSLAWWMDGKKPRLLITEDLPPDEKQMIAVVDIENRKVIDHWRVEATDAWAPMELPGSGLWYMSGGLGLLYKAIPKQKRLVTVAVNPTPAECRCLAVSPNGQLGTYTYDSGCCFTRDLETGKCTSHGRLWRDDHRTNYSPSAFAGKTGRYYVGNFSESMPMLWVTDTLTNKHLNVGGSATQLVRFRDGTVWGVQGPSGVVGFVFDAKLAWIPAWHAKCGTLFRYTPGATRVKTFPELGLVGPIAESPTVPGQLYAATGNNLRCCDTAGKVIREWNAPADVIAAATDYGLRTVYFALSDGSIQRISPSSELEECASGFGPIERGMFVLPKSNNLVGIGIDGTVSVYNHQTDAVSKISGPVPAPAGPAADPKEDAWYFADRDLWRYSIE